MADTALATVPTNNPQINDVRLLLIEQMRALRSAKPGQDLEAEVQRAKQINDLGQTMINSAKVEVDYLVATGQQKAAFLEEPPDPSVAHLGNTATGMVTQQGNRTVHKLRG